MLSFYHFFIAIILLCQLYCLRLKKAGDCDSAREVLQLLEAKISLCFRFLSHEDDDVSSAVMDFAKEYVQVIRRLLLTDLT